MSSWPCSGKCDTNQEWAWTTPATHAVDPHPRPSALMTSRWLRIPRAYPPLRRAWIVFNAPARRRASMLATGKRRSRAVWAARSRSSGMSSRALATASLAVADVVVDTVIVAPSRLGDHGVLEHPELVDLDPNGRACVQTTRRGHDKPDAGRRAGGDDRAGQQWERGRKVGDELPAVGDHLLGRRVLTQITVDPGTDGEIVRIADLISGDQPRPDRAMRVPRLAHRHRRRGSLPIPNRHVVDDEVTGDHRLGVGHRHVAATGADHDSELTFVVDPLRCHRRHLDACTRAHHACDLLVEHHRRLRLFHPALGHMVRVVETDRKERRWLRDRCFELYCRKR